MAITELETIKKEEPERLHIEMPRRAFLLKLGFVLKLRLLLCSWACRARYALSSFRNEGSFKSWISLGPVTSFPREPNAHGEIP